MHNLIQKVLNCCFGLLLRCILYVENINLANIFVAFYHKWHRFYSILCEDIFIVIKTYFFVEDSIQTRSVYVSTLN